MKERLGNHLLLLIHIDRISKINKHPLQYLVASPVGFRFALIVPTIVVTQIMLKRMFGSRCFSKGTADRDIDLWTSFDKLI